MHEDHEDLALARELADSAQFAKAFIQILKAAGRTPPVLDVEGLEEPAPIDTSWMREENWDLGRLAPAA